MTHIPKRLKTEPLIEAIWQIQFEPVDAQPIGDILPGVLYPQLKARYSDLQLQRLPTADIPEPFLRTDPNLRFMAKYRMSDPNGHFLFQTGERVITINCRMPYIGWDGFKEEILELIRLMRHGKLIPEPQRHSLRYIDLLKLDDAPGLSALQLSVVVGEKKIKQSPMQIRLEMPDKDGFFHVLQIASPAKVGLSESNQQEGTIVDLETFVEMNSIDWDVLTQQVDSLHGRSKAMFFQSLLTPTAIELLKPEY